MHRSRRADIPGLSLARWQQLPGSGSYITHLAVDTEQARLIGMDPLEFRFVNAYRDGDLKAHRQPTEGAALIECMQEASRVANWPVAEKYMAMSSYRKGA